MLSGVSEGVRTAGGSKEACLVALLERGVGVHLLVVRCWLMAAPAVDERGATTGRMLRVMLGGRVVLVVGVLITTIHNSSSL